jgi:hypothetical protein
VLLKPDVWRRGRERADQLQEDRDQGATGEAERNAGEKPSECLLLGGARIDRGDAEKRGSCAGLTGPPP